MTITRLHKGPRMSQIVMHGDVVYLAGQVGEGSTITEQTRDMLDSVDRLLAEAGSSKSNILTATIWLSDMADFDALNAVWEAWIDPNNPPARACGEAKLARPDLLVEVIVTAVKQA